MARGTGRISEHNRAMTPSAKTTEKHVTITPTHGTYTLGVAYFKGGRYVLQLRSEAKSWSGIQGLPLRKDGRILATLVSTVSRLPLACCYMYRYVTIVSFHILRDVTTINTPASSYVRSTPNPCRSVFRKRFGHCEIKCLVNPRQKQHPRKVISIDLYATELPAHNHSE